MKRMNQMASHLGVFSRASLGGKVALYRDKQNIYTQGPPAYALLLIKKAGYGSGGRDSLAN
jgi:hypothetical protein